jgi:hypothetical protein
MISSSDLSSEIWTSRADEIASSTSVACACGNTPSPSDCQDSAETQRAQRGGIRQQGRRPRNSLARARHGCHIGRALAARRTSARLHFSRSGSPRHRDLLLTHALCAHAEQAGILMNARKVDIESRNTRGISWRCLGTTRAPQDASRPTSVGQSSVARSFFRGSENRGNTRPPPSSSRPCRDHSGARQDGVEPENATLNEPGSSESRRRGNARAIVRHGRGEPAPASLSRAQLAGGRRRRSRRSELHSIRFADLAHRHNEDSLMPGCGTESPASPPMGATPYHL